MDDTAEEPPSFNVSNEELCDKYTSSIDKFVAKYLMPQSDVIEDDGGYVLCSLPIKALFDDH